MIPRGGRWAGIGLEKGRSIGNGRRDTRSEEGIDDEFLYEYFYTTL